MFIPKLINKIWTPVYIPRPDEFAEAEPSWKELLIFDLIWGAIVITLIFIFQV